MNPFSSWRALRTLAVLLAGFSLSLAARASDPVVFHGQTMGTTYEVKVLGELTAEVGDEIQARLDEINQRMSTYRDDSDVSRFNRAAADTWVPVERETAKVVALALDIARRTGGAFDPTVGPAVSLWNFGPQREAEFIPPPSEAIQSALRRVGHDKVMVREDPPALKKSLAGVGIDLSGVAKGYAVDQLVALLVARGCTDLMVEVGGEVRTLGTVGGSAWKIGVESPRRRRREIDSVVLLADAAMASSGDYRNYFEYEGETYSHTIDPSTGRPVTHNVAATTVVTNSCAEADALATAMLVMGPEAREWAADNGVQLLMLTRDGARIARTTTPDFPLAPITQKAAGGFLPIFLAALAVFAIAIGAMALGTLISGKRLQGSCGGIAGLKDTQGQTLCDLCTKPSPECTGDPEAAGALRCEE